jgi:uncharacterized integral membrane protein
VADKPEQSETGASVQPKRRRMSPAAGAVLGGLGVLFAVLNAQAVQMHWIVSTTRTPLIVVIAIFTLIGFAGGVLWGRSRHR